MGRGVMVLVPFSQTFSISNTQGVLSELDEKDPVGAVVPRQRHAKELVSCAWSTWENRRPRVQKVLRIRIPQVGSRFTSLSPFDPLTHPNTQEYFPAPVDSPTISPLRRPRHCSRLPF